MIYLDNCATTRIRKEVLDKIVTSYKNDFGNPSSLHRLGLNSEKKIAEAREKISKSLRVDSSEIYFTSGGTESNNIAIQGVVDSRKKRGKHIITSKIEHSSILNIMKNYEEEGFYIDYLSTDSYGNIDLKELEKKLREDTILVSIIHVNNEIGSIENIREIKNIINKINPQTHLHVDGIQSLGKIKFSLRDLEIDSFSFSGHKIYGPKGIGGLYVRKGTRINPILFGGNQEEGVRSGTENLQGIIGLGEAVKTIYEKYEEESKYVKELKKYTIEKIQGEIEDIRINSPLEISSPYVLNISFRNTRGEVILHYLEDKEIYVSTSSACSSKGTEKSHVLKSIGLSDNEIEGTIRICFSYENTREDIDYAVKILKESVKEIREIMVS